MEMRVASQPLFLQPAPQRVTQHTGYFYVFSYLCRINFPKWDSIGEGTSAFVIVIDIFKMLSVETVRQPVLPLLVYKDWGYTFTCCTVLHRKGYQKHLPGLLAGGQEWRQCEGVRSQQSLQSDIHRDLMGQGLYHYFQKWFQGTED